MEYNENYKDAVIAIINTAISLLEKAKTTANGITSIPDDFERKEDISNLKEDINNIKLGYIYIEITSLTNGYANADTEASQKSSEYENPDIGEWENTFNATRGSDMSESIKKFLNEVNKNRGSELARYEEEKGKAKLKTSEDKAKKGDSLLEYIGRKGIIDILDRYNEKYRKHANEESSGETHIYMEESEMEDQHSYDNSIAGNIQSTNNGDVKKVEEVKDDERQKEIDALIRELEEQKKYINKKYSNEVQILLEELKAEAKYSFDGSMAGYIEAMNNGDVKRVGEILDNLIKQGKRTIIDKEIVIAQCIHNYLENNNYEYHSTDLIGLYSTFDESKNSTEYKRVSSATYVYWVLNELGYIKVTGEKEELTDNDFTSSNIMYSENDINDILQMH